MDEKCELEKIIADAFRHHFGYDIVLADKEEFMHLCTEGSDIQSFLYLNETFLYITNFEIDSILCDKDGAKVTMKMKYKFV